jgi:hypothetical protein
METNRTAEQTKSDPSVTAMTTMPGVTGPADSDSQNRPIHGARMIMGAACRNSVLKIGRSLPPGSVVFFVCLGLLLYQATYAEPAIPTMAAMIVAVGWSIVWWLMCGIWMRRFFNDERLG